MIDVKEVRHIARLVRLRLDERELASYREDLARILEGFSRMQEVDVSRADPLTHPASLVNVFREDKPGKTGSEECLRSMFADCEGDLLRIQSVLERP